MLRGTISFGLVWVWWVGVVLVAEVGRQVDGRDEGEVRDERCFVFLTW